MTGAAIVLDMHDRHALGAVAFEQVSDAAHDLASYSMGTKIEWRIWPEMALEKCPLPDVSSTSSTSPAPMMRVSPSLAWMLTPPSRLMMYCRRGAGCHS